MKPILIAALLLVPACAQKGQRSPEKLRDAYVDALKTGDAKAAYAMLAPDVKQQITFEDFAARWKSQKDERAAAVTSAGKLTEAQREPVREGTTAHPGGHVLKWIEAGGRYYVVEGLPGTPTTTTPAQTIRALIAAVRTTDMTRIRSLLGDELADAVDEDWQSRVEAMEAALDRPGSIELSSDLRRAELRYEQGRVLTLQQTPRGWRITALE